MLAMFSVNSSMAQLATTPWVLASTGQYAAVSGLEVSYTLGEMAAVTTISNTSVNMTLTQGFHQPEELTILTALNETKGSAVNFTLYPVPANESLWFGYQMEGKGRATLEVYDVTGKLVSSLPVYEYTGGAVVSSVAVADLSQGSYLARLTYTRDGGATEISSKPFSIIR